MQRGAGAAAGSSSPAWPWRSPAAARPRPRTTRRARPRPSPRAPHNRRPRAPPPAQRHRRVHDRARTGTTTAPLRELRHDGRRARSARSPRASTTRPPPAATSRRRCTACRARRARRGDRQRQRRRRPRRAAGAAGSTRSSASRSCAADTSSRRPARARRSRPSAARFPARPRRTSSRPSPIHAYLQVVHQVTGAQVLLLLRQRVPPAPPRPPLAGTIGGSLPASAPAAGPLTLAGQSYQTFTLPGAVYPSGALRIVLLVPVARRSPAPARSRRRAWKRSVTSANASTRRSSTARTSPRRCAHMESSTAFQRAVAAGSVAATRAAIIDFFARPHPRRARARHDRRAAADRRRRPVRARPRPRHAAQRRARRRPLRDGDPGRRRLPEARPPVHRRRSPDAHGLASGDGHALARSGDASPTGAKSPTAGAPTRRTRSWAKLPRRPLRISLLLARLARGRPKCARDADPR